MKAAVDRAAGTTGASAGASATAAAQPAPRPTWLLLHGSGSHGGMWRALLPALAPGPMPLAPDLIGYGRSPLRASAALSVDDELQALAPMLDAVGGPLHLVGHSYGGVVAAALACARPQRIASLTLIEPVLFSVLQRQGADGHWAYFDAMRRAFLARLRAGDAEAEAAMAGFTEGWRGPGSWLRLPPEVRRRLIGQAGRIGLDWQASFAARPSPDALRQLGPRTLLLRGDASPAAMAGLVAALQSAMPGSGLRVLPGAGHDLPLTHGPQLARLLQTQQRRFGRGMGPTQRRRAAAPQALHQP